MMWMRRWKRWIWMLALLCVLPATALGEAGEYDAAAAEDWLGQFCQALTMLTPIGDAAQTADPARPGEYLIEYDFGTVLADCEAAPQAQDVLEIDVRTAQVTDCRGMRVGMTLSEALNGESVGKSNTQLYVLGTQEAGLGFHWAYIGGSGVYGLEYITYGAQDDGTMREYTLTYVIGEDGVVSAIRMRMSSVTQAEAEDALATAEEIAQRQIGEMMAMANDEPAMEASDLRLMDLEVLGVSVADLVTGLGEPVEVQSVTEGNGRLLLYEGATVELGFNVQTGEEVVLGVSVSGTDVDGPRGLRVGMSIQEAAALFRCDEEVYTVGGILYMEGEAAGEPPYGELVRCEMPGELMLHYAAQSQSGETAVLEIGIQDSVVTYWHFFNEVEGQHDVI